LENTLIAPDFLSSEDSDLFWRNATVGDAEIDRCLVYKLNSSSNNVTGFEHSQCNATNHYICEVDNSLTKKNTLSDRNIQPLQESPQCPSTCSIDVKTILQSVK
jgi:hypothetical protein